MMTKTGKNFRKVNTCEHCKHVFIFHEYDEGLEFYCHLDKSDRPRSGSVGMRETFQDGFNEKGEDIWHLQSEAWDEWSKNRRVGNTICDDFETEAESR